MGNGGLNLSNHLKRFRAFPYDSTRVDTLTQFWSPSKEHAFPAVAADSGNGKAGGAEREGGESKWPRRESALVFSGEETGDLESSRGELV